MTKTWTSDLPEGNEKRQRHFLLRHCSTLLRRGHDVESTAVSFESHVFIPAKTPQAANIHTYMLFGFSRPVPPFAFAVGFGSHLPKGWVRYMRHVDVWTSLFETRLRERVGGRDMCLSEKNRFKVI